MIDMNKIKTVVEGMKCKEHNKPPFNIEITEKDIQYETCCKNFHEEIKETVREEIQKQIRDDLSNRLSKQ